MENAQFSGRRVDQHAIDIQKMWAGTMPPLQMPELQSLERVLIIDKVKKVTDAFALFRQYKRDFVSA